MKSPLLVVLLTLLPASVAVAQFGATAPPLPNETQTEAADAIPEAAAADDNAAGASNAMFNVIDADRDGVISKVELRKAARALKTLDADNDGNITLAEVGASTVAAPVNQVNPEVGRIMAEFDKNNDSQLTADEVPPHLMPMLQGADKNQDRAIDSDELQAVVAQAAFRGGPGAGLGPNGRGMDPRTGQFLKNDVNNDGRLTPQEIPRNMRQAFRPEDDRNGDGAIDAAELQIVIRRLGGGARAAAAGVQPGRDPNTFRDPDRRKRPSEDEQN